MGILLFTLILPSLSTAGDFKAFITQLPPIKIIQDDKASGIASDVLIRIMEKAGFAFTIDDIVFAPWQESYDITRTTPKTICLGMARTESRIAEFKWVGPIYTAKLGLIASKKLHIPIKNFQEATSFRIGTIKGSAPEKILVQEGVPLENLTRFDHNDEAIRMLHSGQIDLLAFPKSSALYGMLQIGIDPNDYEMVLEFRDVDMYYAFYPLTDDIEILKIQTALDDLKKNGPNGISEYHEIISKYFRPSI